MFFLEEKLETLWICYVYHKNASVFSGKFVKQYNNLELGTKYGMPILTHKNIEIPWNHLWCTTLVSHVSIFQSQSCFFQYFLVFKSFSTDVTQVCLQRKEKTLMWYFRQIICLGWFKKDKTLILRKPLYGLTKGRNF